MRCALSLLEVPLAQRGHVFLLLSEAACKEHRPLRLHGLPLGLHLVVQVHARPLREEPHLRFGLCAHFLRASAVAEQGFMPRWLVAFCRAGPGEAPALPRCAEERVRVPTNVDRDANLWVLPVEGVQRAGDVVLPDVSVWSLRARHKVSLHSHQQLASGFNRSWEKISDPRHAGNLHGQCTRWSISIQYVPIGTRKTQFILSSLCSELLLHSWSKLTSSGASANIFVYPFRFRTIFMEGALGLLRTFFVETRLALEVSHEGPMLRKTAKLSRSRKK